MLTVLCKLRSPPLSEMPVNTSLVTVFSANSSPLQQHLGNHSSIMSTWSKLYSLYYRLEYLFFRRFARPLSKHSAPPKAPPATAAITKRRHVAVAGPSPGATSATNTTNIASTAPLSPPASSAEAPLRFVAAIPPKVEPRNTLAMVSTSKVLAGNT